MWLLSGYAWLLWFIERLPNVCILCWQIQHQTVETFLFFLFLLSLLFSLSHFLLSAHQTEPWRGFLLWWKACVWIWKWAFLSHVPAIKNKMYTYRGQCTVSTSPRRSLGLKRLDHNNSCGSGGGLEPVKGQRAGLFSYEEHLALRTMTQGFKATLAKMQTWKHLQQYVVRESEAVTLIHISVFSSERKLKFPSFSQATGLSVFSHWR